MKNTPERKQGPEKVFIDYYEFETGDTSGGWYDHNYNDEDFTYIREDISEAKESLAYSKGVTAGRNEEMMETSKMISAENLFTKEQVEAIAKRAWNGGAGLYKNQSYEEWVEQIKPFDSK